MMRTMLTTVNVFKSSFRILRKLCISFYSGFNLFQIAVCFVHFDFYKISTPVMHTMLTMVNVVQIIISDIVETVYIRFTMF